MFPIGPSINAIAIFVGAAAGMMIGSRLSDNLRKTVFQCLALSTLVIALQMALKTNQPILLIFSLVVGGIIGEILKIDDKINAFGDFIKNKIKSKNPHFTEGFVNASLLFCIGAMGILAAFDEGLRGDYSIALSKSILDVFSALAIASVYGLGVVFSGIIVFFYQGFFVVFAELLQPYMNDIMLNELTAVGGALVIGIALNLLEIVQIRLANLLPALIMVPIFVQFV